MTHIYYTYKLHDWHVQKNLTIALYLFLKNMIKLFLIAIIIQLKPQKNCSVLVFSSVF